MGLEEEKKNEGGQLCLNAVGRLYVFSMCVDFWIGKERAKPRRAVADVEEVLPLESRLPG